MKEQFQKVPCGGFKLGGGLSIQDVPASFEFTDGELKTKMEKNVITDGTVTLKILVGNAKDPFDTTSWTIAPDSNVKNIDDVRAYMQYGYQTRVMIYVEKDGQRFFIGNFGVLKTSNVPNVYFEATQLIISGERTSNSYISQLSIISWHNDGHFSLGVNEILLPLNVS